ncbi:putative zinc-binding metallopeptidase [Belliella marina]|uniref:Zinc-binding metallopeptidase n=1 Tax=Belliella marina TaxID=1644146 RepID=A0ABW4VG63_9BACT
MKRYIIDNKCFDKVSALVLSFVVFSCAVQEDLSKPILGLEGDVWEKTEIDHWLDENFLVPYNVEVKYRWDASELAIDRTLVPPQEERVIPIMEVVKEGWIDVYNKETQEAFIKRYAPKQYQLVGSPQYNSNGTITVGQAEAGRKVVLFRVNQFERSNRTMVKRTLKTIHHEFAHILHQNIMYAPEYKEITPGAYTASWNTLSDAQAREMGFITPYSSSSPDEDFVEMIAIMLTEGKLGYENILAGISSPQAVQALRRKEEIVVTYFKQVWDIDFYKLQETTTLAIEDISPSPVTPLHTILGAEETYSTLKLDLEEREDQSGLFMGVFQTANETLGTLGNAGRFIESVDFTFVDAGSLLVSIAYKNPNNLASTFYADFGFDYHVDGDGVADFTYTGPPEEAVTRNNNARVIESYVMALMDYLGENNFKIDWKDGRPQIGTTDQFGKFTVEGDDENYFFGLLGN